MRSFLFCFAKSVLFFFLLFFVVAVTTRKLHGGRYEQGKRMFYHENGTGAAVGVASVVRERLGHDTGHK